MFCLLIGLSPPSEETFDYFCETVTTIQNDSTLEWNKYEICLANDVDNDNAPTLLVSAVSEAHPDDVMKAVDSALQQQHQHSFHGDEKKENHPTSTNNNDNDNKKVQCELWASAPCPLPLRPRLSHQYPFEFSSSSTTTTITTPFHNDYHDGAGVLSCMREWGVWMQRSVLDVHQVFILRKLVEDAIDEAEGLLKLYRPEIQIGKDAFCFREMASRSQERFDLRLDRNPYILTFIRQHLLGEQTASFLHQWFNIDNNDDIDFDISVVYSKPGANHQGWHSDGNHMPGASDAGWNFSSNGSKCLASAYAICMFLPLIPLDDEVGYTQFWPGSHRHRDLVGFGKVAEIANATYDAKCQAGDAVWYDYRTLHRGMPNHSHSTTRPIVQIIFKRKWYKEKQNYGIESIASNSNSNNNVPSPH
jgi:ectoine hydroxylase-related dioxygenase (phytanoyl-CoA dioxygenase family)